MSYSNLLSEDLHDFESDSTIQEDIHNKKYDLIIYGSYHRGMPYYDQVISIYPAEKIILLCGEDEHRCNYSLYNNRGIMCLLENYELHGIDPI